MQFANVVGHTELKEKLIKAVNDGRISHAQLFLGPEGSGNFALALAYAQYVMCTNRSETDACGQCPSCLKVRKLAHPDLHFVMPVPGAKRTSDQYMDEFREALLTNVYLTNSDWLEHIKEPTKNSIINVDQCAELMRKLQLKPFEAIVKVMVIWLPERIYTSAAPKLLKIIEEPPEATLFLLVSNNADKILGTILSRTQLVKVNKINDFDMLGVLTGTHQIAMEKAQEIVNIADGDFNLALKHIAYDDFQDDNFRMFTDWMRSSFKLDVIRLSTIAEELGDAGRDKNKSFYMYALHMIRQALASKGTPELMRVTDKERNFLLKFAPFIHAQNAGEISQKMNEAIDLIERNANAKILFMSVSLQVASLLKVKKEYI